MLGGILAPAMMKKVGWKPTFIIGGIGFCIVVVEQVLPAWYDEVQSNPGEVKGKWYSFLVNRTFVEVSNFFSNVIAGFGGSFIWVAQGDYLAKCATESSKGFYYGYFWV